MQKNITEAIADADAEYQAARAARDAAADRLLQAKDALSKLLNVRAVASRLTAAEAASVGLTVVDGQVVQELPE